MNSELIGEVVMYLTAWSAILLLTVILCRVSNRVSYMVLECYGGWRKLLEYRKWYLEQKEGEK